MRCFARLATVLAPGALLLLVGCADAFGNKDAHQPGTQLGRFHVAASRTSNACGEGALGVTPAWEFDVDLARGATSLFWDNGAQVITGNLMTDAVSFRFESEIAVDMRTELDLGLPPCTVVRHDVAGGALDSATDEVTGFTGTLDYAFAPGPDSECSDLVLGGSETPLFAALPCAMAFDLTAVRTELPLE
jgi:hypothetical protein